LEPTLMDDTLPLGRRSDGGKRRPGQSKTKMIVLALLGTILLGSLAGFLWLRSIESKMRLDDAEKIEKVTAKPTGDVVTALLVGTDRRPGWNSSRADSIVFIRADKNQGRVHMLSIPRDTRVSIPASASRREGLDKINHAWAFGGAPLLITTVSDFLDMPVNYFLQVDFTQFEQAVDALGGVDFASDVGWYDGELGVQVRSGLQTRGGKEALALVRNRTVGAGGGSDLNRVAVQQQFLMAMITQSIGSPTDVPRVANVVSSYVNTNMGLTEMLGLGRNFAGGDMEMDKAVVPGKSGMISGVSYIIPDIEGKNRLISAMKDNQPFPQIGPN
jgi:polyisoprenyl-teichoic acid--peptidoglycan teichoic acid transferase